MLDRVLVSVIDQPPVVEEKQTVPVIIEFILDTVAKPITFYSTVRFNSVAPKRSVISKFIAPPPNHVNSVKWIWKNARRGLSYK